MLFIADIYRLKRRLSSQLWWHISVTQPQEAETGVQEFCQVRSPSCVVLKPPLSAPHHTFYINIGLIDMKKDSEK